MTHRGLLLLSMLMMPVALAATPAGAETTAALRAQIDHFTTVGRSDYAACAQHIALEYQWSAFLRTVPGAAITKCARDLRSSYDAEMTVLENALRHDKKAQAALRAYYADWRLVIDGLKPGPQSALQANLDRLEAKAAAIKLRQADAKPTRRYGEVAPLARPQPETQAAD